MSRNDTVQEGGSIDLTLVSSILIDSDLAINLQYNDENNLLDSESLTSVIQFPAGETIVSVPTIHTIDNSIQDFGGIITISLQTGEGYEIASEPVDQVLVRVEDNDVTSGISITNISPDFVDEGDIVQFMITTPTQFNQDRTINLKIEESGEYLARIPPSSVTLAANELMTILELATVQDVEFNIHSEIEVTLLAGDSYTVADKPHNNAIVTVFDDDILPGVSVVAVEPSIIEGDLAKFQFNLSETFAQDVTVWYYFLGSERDYLPVVIPSGEKFAEIAIQTENNEEVQFEQPIEIAIHQVSEEIEINTAYSEASVEVINDDVTTLAISSNGNVTEGTDASFTVTSSPAPINDLEVHFDVLLTGNFIKNSVPSSITLGAGLEETTILIPTFNDTIDELDGEVSISLSESLEYEISLSSPSAQAEITDDDEVLISVLNNTSNSAIEGSNFNFSIQADRPLPNDILVRLSYQNSGNFELGNVIQYQQLAAGSNSTTVSNSVIDDSDFTVPTSLSIELAASSGYTIDENNSSINMLIYDNDSPEGVSILPIDSHVEEGDDIPFSVSIIPPFTTDQVVQLKVTEVGEFLAEPQINEIEIGANQVTSELAIPTIDDDTHEIDGDVKVELLPGTGYSVAETYHSALVKVRDNDNPLGLSILPMSPTITEGELARFQVIAASTVAEDTLVTFAVEEVGHFLPFEIPESVMILSGSRSTTISVQTADDSSYETRGRIIVSILPSDDYLVADQPSNSASIEVIDNDQPQAVSILAIYDSVIEGQPALFELSVPSVAPDSRTFEFNVEQVGEFLTPNTETHVVVLEAFQAVMNFALPTLDDNIFEVDGQITLTLSTANEENTNHYTSAEVAIIDNDSPTISITAIENSVVEGSPAQFRIDANTAPIQFMELFVNISQFGDFINEPLGMKTVSLLPGETSTELHINTADDNIYDGVGLVSATLISGERYQIADYFGEASIDIQDNDAQPEVSIATELTEAEEGRVLNFTISANSISASDYDVGVQITDHQSDFLAANIPDFVTIDALSPATNFEVNTLDDDFFEFDGQVTVTLLSGIGYTLSTNLPNSASVDLLDNDGLPTLAISSYEDTAFEGDETLFIITPSHRSSSDIRINVTTQSEFQDSPETHEVTLLAYAYSAIFEFVSEHTDQQSGDYQLTTQLQAGQGYQVASEPEHQSTIIIKDIDVLPELAISAVNPSVNEGGTAEFMVESSPALPVARTIHLLVSRDSGDGEISTETMEQELQPSASTAVIKIPTYQDEFDWPNGQIAVSINPGSDYLISSSASDALVEVLDDDLNSVFFSSSGSTVVEGEELVVELKVFPAIEREFTVNLGYEVEGDFVNSNYQFQREMRIWLTNYVDQQFISNIRIPTNDDSNFEPHGHVKITLEPGSNYTIDESKVTSAEFTILDNDAPANISVIAKNSEITEGDTAIFEIRKPTKDSYEQYINFSITENGNFMQFAPPEFAVLKSYENVVEVNVSTVDDGFYEESGLITMSLLDGFNYRLADTNSSASVVVNDNDNYFLSIFSGDDITEGEDAIFTISSTQTPSENLEIALDIDTTGNFIDSDVVDSIVLAAGSDSIELHIPTTDNEEFEQNGNITVSILTGAGYQVDHSDSTATLVVFDNDKLAGISIQSLASSVIEGQSVRFRVVADTSIGEERSININLNSENPGHLADTETESVVIPRGISEVII